MEDIITTFILSAGPEFALTFIGLLIIIGSEINTPGKISQLKHVRNLLCLIGFVILFTGLYFMLLKIDFDIFIEAKNLFTRENLIILSIALIIGIIIYHLLNIKRYSITVSDFSNDEQVYINIVNDGKEEITCVAYLESLEKIYKGKKEEIVNIPSNIFLWGNNTSRVKLYNMGEGRFWVLDVYSKEMCLALGGSDNLPLEYGKKHIISIGIYRLNHKSSRSLMKIINAEFVIKIENQSSIYRTEYKIDWNLINIK